MPFPAIPILSALMAGGTLVPHSSGGLIVYANGGYLANTYLSTAALKTFLLGTTTAGTAGGLGVFATFGAGVWSSITGFWASIIGSAGYFGTTIGATGLTGWAMSVGLIDARPIWHVVVAGLAALLCWVILSYLGFRVIRLIWRVARADQGEEVHFTAREAAVVERFLKWWLKRRGPDPA